MKAIVTIAICILFLQTGFSQTLIHAHNDYEKQHPLFGALEYRASSIEADVFLVKGSLLVAHTIKESSRKKSLESVYIGPIIELFKKHNKRISEDSNYKVQLVIDIKQNGSEVLQALQLLFEPLRDYFDRSVNPNAVQIVISGDRGAIAEWKNLPSYFLFDGRPFEEYNDAALSKVAMISDNYFNYLELKTNRGDSIKIKQVIARAKALNKPFRFWGSPDNEAIWRFLVQCDAAILNTDNPAACRKFLDSKL